MEKHGCVKIELDDAKYSLPVPVIGLYITAASLVCLLAMLYDIVSGFRHRKRWIPCRLFSLNSVTLTLLSVTAKLPVDLTTPMPSALDQISKLTATTFICISMGFLMPSLGGNQKSECLTNMAALSILVVTVVVNICIQINTGVIIMFKTEHIIVMCCMLVLLFLMWFSAVVINRQKDLYFELNKNQFTKSYGSLLGSLKLAFLYGYNSNSQFLLCKQPSCQVVSLICIPCLGVIMHAALRSLDLEFCRGVSDYDWSMWILVFMQILTIILGSFVTSFRLFALYTHKRKLDYYMSDEATDVRYSNPFLGMKLSEFYSGLAEALMCYLIAGVLIFFYTPFDWVYGYFALVYERWYRHFHKHKDNTEEYTDLVSLSDLRLDEWSVQKSVKEMKRLMEVRANESLNHLSQLLSKYLDPSQDLHTMELKDPAHPNQEGIEASSLSLVLLVRIAQLCLPPTPAGSLVQAYEESRALIQFIDKRVYFASLKNRKRLELAQAVWIGDEFGSRLIEQDGWEGSDLEHALARIEGIKNTLPSDFVWDEVGVITTFISRREHLSAEDLYSFIEKMFVDMMHILLARLPHAIYKEVTESPAEEYDERIAIALRFVCQIRLLEAPIQWLFPAGSNISRMVNSQVDDAPNQANTRRDFFAALNITVF